MLDTRAVVHAHERQKSRMPGPSNCRPSARQADVGFAHTRSHQTLAVLSKDAENSMRTSHALNRRCVVSPSPSCSIYISKHGCAGSMGVEMQPPVQLRPQRARTEQRNHCSSITTGLHIRTLTSRMQLPLFLRRSLCWRSYSASIQPFCRVCSPVSASLRSRILVLD